MTPHPLMRFARSALGLEIARMEPLAGGGSTRCFYRLHAPGRTLVGVVAQDRAELRAYLAFTRHFAAQGIPVAEIHAADEQGGLYLMQDLGDATLADWIGRWREQGRHEAVRAALARVVCWLPVIQVRGGAGLDLSLCHDGSEQDAAAYWADIDLFLREYAARIAPADKAPPAPVRADLERLAARLDALSREHFCYRDFQARNIMWLKDAPVFIDYQSGRRGALVYDLASLLFSPDSRLEESDRPPLIDAYLDALAAEGVREERERFLEDFYAVVLVRRLQALGAYARIARVKGAEAYLKKIPPTLETLRRLQAAGHLRLGLPHLEGWMEHLLAAPPRSIGEPA